MTEAEFERRLATPRSVNEGSGLLDLTEATTVDLDAAPRSAAAGSSRPRSPRLKQVKPKRVQRMFAIEEDLDKKLWLYAIHLGKDRSEVVNDLLRPIVASMVLYDSRDRRGRNADAAPDRTAEIDSDVQV
jgi:hypothetical protein